MCSKKLLSVALALFSGVAECATIERTLVRQMWPWNGEIRVEYRISGVTDPVDVQVGLSGNGQAIDVPTSAISGDVFSVMGDGIYAITLASPTNWVPQAVKDLSVTLTPVASSTTEANVIYRVYDLVSGACEDITVGSILNGSRGAWHWADPSGACLRPGEANDAAGLNLVWTGFNSDIAYKTTKLVMRYLPAKDQTVNLLNRSDRTGTVPVSCYIGVYEITQKQWELVMGSAAECSWPGDAMPVNTVSYNAIRGAGEANYWNDYSINAGANPPAEGSFLGLLRAKTKADFDLPTRAMWEYASQVNSLWRFASNGKDESACVKAGWNDNSPFDHIPISAAATDANFPGTYAGNAGSKKGPAVVGSYNPNMIGLYDTLGNVVEWCVDWHDGNVNQTNYTDCKGAANVDPEDCTKVWKTNADDKTGYKRFRAGSSYETALTGGMTPNYILSGSGASPDYTGAATGLRVVIVTE